MSEVLQLSTHNKLTRGFVNPQTGLVFDRLVGQWRTPKWITPEQWLADEAERAAKKEARRIWNKNKNRIRYYQNIEEHKKRLKAYRIRPDAKQRATEYHKIWRAKNREDQSLKKKEYYQNNKEKFRAYFKKRGQTDAHRAQHNEVTAKRRAAKGRGATYGRFEVKFLYALCRAINSGGGVIHHVDHIYPLHPRDKSYCGLHVPANLRIVPAMENQRKHRETPDQNSLKAA